MKKKGEEN